MRIVKAEHAGACYGVQRALDLAYHAIAKTSEVCTLGPLIHNPQVVDDLAGRGVRVAAGLDDVDDTSTIIIRSHGVIPAVLREIERRGLSFVDATCPHVARAQQAAAALAGEGRKVIVVGEEGHPEVESLCAYASAQGGEVHVAAKAQDLPDDIEEPLGVVVQTTQAAAALQGIVDELEHRGLNPEVKNTICFATRQRQLAASKLAGIADAIVVIGGRNSSNTTRLTEICKALCPRTYHIESPEEIDSSWFGECDTIGVTAGASTPEGQIEAVVDRLRKL